MREKRYNKVNDKSEVRKEQKMEYLFENFNMAVSSIKATFQCDIKSVGELATSLDKYSWRSDLGKIEIIREAQFIEYTKDGYATTFTVTAKEPYRRWEFDVENDNMKGHWTGIFTQKNGQTEVDFTEEVTVFNLLQGGGNRQDSSFFFLTI